MVEEGGQLARADHRGLVDDDHGAGRQRPLRPVAVVEQAGQRRRRNACAGLQPSPGDCGERGPAHRNVGLPPNLRRRGERGRLTGAGGSHDHVGGARRRQQCRDHCLLLVAEPASFEKPPYIVGFCGTDPRRSSGGSEGPLLDREQLVGAATAARVRVGAVEERHRGRHGEEMVDGALQFGARDQQPSGDRRGEGL